PDSGPLIEAFIQNAVGGAVQNIGALLQSVQEYSKLNAVVHCADFPFTDPGDVYSTLLPELQSENPRFSHAELPSLLPCAHFSAPHQPHPAPHAKGAPPILVVGSTGDQSTPYWWSERLADELETGVLLTHDGFGHNYSSQCIDDAVVSYLLYLKVPDEGTV